jgi:signal transduction histidine kinase
VKDLRNRVAGLDARHLDAILALALIAEIELETWLGDGISESHRLAAALVAVLYAAPIAVRRRWPAAALLCCSTVALTQALLGGSLSANGVLLAPIVLVYSVGAWLDLRRGLVATIFAAGAFGGFVLASEPNLSSPGKTVDDLVFACVLFATPWFVGRLVAERSRRAAAFAGLAVQAAAQHDESERAAIALERVRIGRELQDIIAHSVSAMVIQAGGARLMLRSEPTRARDSILAVEETGREALADLRRLLGMLRKDDDARALAPQPGLDQLAMLLRATRDTGVECDLRCEGQPIDLTPGIDLVGYRVVEAALASAARHHSRRAGVIVRYLPKQLELEIRGDTTMSDLDAELPGLTERVALYDGNLRALDGSDDGFVLHALLPLRAAVHT